MPEVNVCLWNIQNYGQAAFRYDGFNGNSNALRNTFITAFVRRHRIEVLMIMEVQPSTGDAALSNLVTKLNAEEDDGEKDWAYSFCDCAIDNKDVLIVNGADDLTYYTGRRAECYGVVWRRSRPTFTMIKALVDISRGTTDEQDSPLNISQRGRPTGTGPDPGPTGGVTAGGTYPYDFNAKTRRYKLMTGWPKLNYPPTGNQEALRPRWWGSRRPVYVVIQLNNDARSLCPVAAYHAPSIQRRAYWGASMAGLMRELFVVDGVDRRQRPVPWQPVAATRGFVGGDFNYSVDTHVVGRGPKWPDAYTYFVAARGKIDDAGAYTLVVPPATASDPNRRTTVQLTTGRNHDHEIDEGDTDAYLWYKIDLGFYPRDVGITARRINLLTEVMVSDAYNDVLTTTGNAMRSYAATATPPNKRFYRPRGPQKKVFQQGNRFDWAYLVTGSWGSTFLDWNNARDQYEEHEITEARVAAEYIHIFVSDHLPLVATFTY